MTVPASITNQYVECECGSTFFEGRMRFLINETRGDFVSLQCSRCRKEVTGEYLVSRWGEAAS